MWLFQRAVMEQAMKRLKKSESHVRLTSAVTTGTMEIDVAGEVGPNEMTYHEPRLHLRLPSQGDVQVTSSCTCGRALCEHAATLMLVLGGGEAQQLVPLIAAAGEGRIAEEPPKPEEITVMVPNDQPRPVLVAGRAPAAAKGRTPASSSRRGRAPASPRCTRC